MTFKHITDFEECVREKVREKRERESGQQELISHKRLKRGYNFLSHSTSVNNDTGQIDLPDGLVFVDGRVDGAANLDRVEVDVAARALLRNFILKRDKQKSKHTTNK